MKQTKVRCIKYENLFRLINVPQSKGQFQLYNNENTIILFQNMMAPRHLTLPPLV